MGVTELKELGLSDNEVKIYLVSLELGLASASKIAKKAGLPRTTTYDLLTALEKKGLAGHLIKSGVKYFEAAPPTKLLSILKEREEKIKRVIPQLMLMQQTATEKPQIELYEGKEGLKTVIDDLINTKKPILAISSTKDLMEKLVFYFPNYIKRRVAAKIPIKVISEKSSQNLELVKKEKQEFREMRFVPPEFNFPNAIYIYGDKIALLSFENEPTGVIITNDSLNKTFRMIFELMWKTATKQILAMTDGI